MSIRLLLMMCGVLLMGCISATVSKGERKEAHKPPRTVRQKIREALITTLRDLRDCRPLPRVERGRPVTQKERDGAAKLAENAHVLLEADARKGLPVACFYLAYANLIAGNLLRPNAAALPVSPYGEVARKYFRMAAEKGHPGAQFELRRWEKDKNKKKVLLHCAADGGHLPALEQCLRSIDPLVDFADESEETWYVRSFLCLLLRMKYRESTLWAGHHSSEKYVLKAFWLAREELFNRTFSDRKPVQPSQIKELDQVVLARYRSIVSGRSFLADEVGLRQ